MEQRCALYRLFSADGVLLYVGITDTPPRRFYYHTKDKAWWPDVAKLLITWYDNREQAAEAELAAIGGEQPLHNVRGTSLWATARQAGVRAAKARQAARQTAPPEPIRRPMVSTDAPADRGLTMQDAAQVALAACREVHSGQQAKDQVFLAIIRTLAA